MKHNLETLMKALNRYLNPDPATGLIPMTPMHMEINAITAELAEMYKGNDFSAHILIQHILNRTGTEILKQ